MSRWARWRDNSAWHHIWVANGPLWFLCGDCRRARQCQCIGCRVIRPAALRRIKRR